MTWEPKQITKKHSSRPCARICLQFAKSLQIDRVPGIPAYREAGIREFWYLCILLNICTLTRIGRHELVLTWLYTLFVLPTDSCAKTTPCKLDSFATMAIYCSFLFVMTSICSFFSAPQERTQVLFVIKRCLIECFIHKPRKIPDIQYNLYNLTTTLKI